MFSLKNWLNLMSFAAGFVIALSVALIVRENEIKRLHNRCEADKAKIETVWSEKVKQSEELNRETLAKISDLDGRLAALKRVHPKRCVVVRAATASGGHAGQPSGNLFAAHERGLESDWLLDFAYDADRAAIDFAACQATLDMIYASVNN